jgi:hypothetical protein
VATNTFLTPELIAQRALANLYPSLVMVPLVYTDVSSQFAAQKIGNTINIRKPTTFTANTFDDTSGIVVQAANETAIPVTLNTIADVSFAVTTEQLTLDIVNFDEQLLTPACMAIAEKVDQDILAMRSQISNTVGTTTNYLWNTPEALIDAGRVLDQANLPSSMRHAVTGPATKAQWLNSQDLKYVMNAGTNDDLRAGSLGASLFGADIFITTNITPAPVDSAAGLPTTEVGVMFHETAFCFASAPLELAPGSFASVQTYNGLSIRVAYQYDITKKQFICSLDTLYGTKVLDANRACLLQGALTGS